MADFKYREKRLGENIKNARLDMKLNLTDLSKLTGICPSTIARYEKNARRPSFENIICLAYHLEVSLYYLIQSGDPEHKTLLQLERII